jgi:hypothetical protein
VQPRLACAFRRHASCSELFVDFFRRLISCVCRIVTMAETGQNFLHKVVAIGSKLV